MVYFTSDLHIGHKNIYKYRDIFKSANEHHNYMIDKILELGKRDVLFVLGDFLFDCSEYNEYIEKLKKAKCRIKLVFGNHDSLKLYKENRLEKLELQLPLFSYKNNWISHCPIHSSEFRGRNLNIHGHLHKEVVKLDTYNDSVVNDIYLPDKRYFNVNIDVNNYEFINFEKIKESLS